MIKKVLIINGVERTLVLEGNETLAKVLRERLLLTGLCLRKLSVQFDRVHKFLRDIVYIMTVDMSTISNQKK
mgnify:CR=1 FL=1